MRRRHNEKRAIHGALRVQQRPPMDNIDRVARMLAQPNAMQRPYPRTHFRHARMIGCNDDEERSNRSEEHTSELQSLMRISYAVFCLKKKNTNTVDKLTNNKYITNK